MRDMKRAYTHAVTIVNARRYYCNEDISKIEGYEAMMADTTQRWVCHHRAETDENKSMEQLIAEGRYYKVRACELIFMTASDHMKLHNKGNKGMHWWNNGEKEVYCKICPAGYVSGRLTKKS